MENYNGNSNGKFDCPVYSRPQLVAACKNFCPYVNDLSGPCFRQSLAKNKFLVYKQNINFGHNDFLFVTDIINSTERIGCSLDQVVVKGIDFRRRTIINLIIFKGEVANAYSVSVDLSQIKVVDLVEAFNLGFRVLNQDYWEKNVVRAMQEEYKKLARKDSC